MKAGTLRGRLKDVDDNAELFLEASCGKSWVEHRERLRLKLTAVDDTRKETVLVDYDSRKPEEWS